MTPKSITITSATHVADYRISLRFNDEFEQIVDFKPFLSRSAHREIRAYLDPIRFADFRIEYGDLVWGDFDLCFPIVDLYRNQIDKHLPLVAAA